jgi:hypothetical protein
VGELLTAKIRKVSGKESCLFRGIPLNDSDLLPPASHPKISNSIQFRKNSRPAPTRRTKIKRRYGYGLIKEFTWLLEREGDFA